MFSTTPTSVQASPARWSLRPYQLEQIAAVTAAWLKHDRTMVEACTGSGKTTLFTELAKQRTAALNGRVLVIAHRIELLDQARDRLTAAGLTAELESGQSKAQIRGFFPADVVVATVQTLKGKRLESWPRDAFHTLIVDEAHHAVAPAYRAILDYFNSAKALGVTATLDRGDDVAIGHVFPHLAHSYPLRQAIKDGYLVPIRIQAIDTPTVDMSTIRITRQEHGKDYNPADLARQMTGEKFLHELAFPIAREARGRQTIVFTPTVEVAHGLAIVLAAYLGPNRVASIDGQTDSATRKESIAKYRRGELQMLLNFGVFTEGFDAPETSCVAIARPTKSRALYTQMVGRGTRLAAGKTDCLVLDLAPENMRHSLFKPVDLFDGKPLPDDLAAELQAAVATGADIAEALENAEAKATEREALLRAKRQHSNLIADVRYVTFGRDPFAIAGVDRPVAPKGDRPTQLQHRDALRSLGVDDKLIPESNTQAEALHNQLLKRRKEGLCSFKQTRILGEKGLRTDLPIQEATKVMAALAANGWKVTADIAERYAK